MNAQGSVAKKAVAIYKLPFVYLKKLYDWVLHWAETPYGGPALFLLAFAEASFFPIPPDPLLIALVLGVRKKAWRYAGIALAGSVLGGMLGYYFGYALFDTVSAIVAYIVGPHTWYGVAHEGAQVVQIAGYKFYNYAAGSPFLKDASVFLRVKAMYDNNAFMAMFTAAFTPIPYKVFTISAGYFHVNPVSLFLAAILGRGGRFFGVAGLIYAFGPPIKRFIDKYFDILAIIFTILLIGGFVLVKHMV